MAAPLATLGGLGLLGLFALGNCVFTGKKKTNIK
jgi:hypothetical protein